VGAILPAGAPVGATLQGRPVRNADGGGGYSVCRRSGGRCRGRHGGLPVHVTLSGRAEVPVNHEATPRLPRWATGGGWGASPAMVVPTVALGTACVGGPGASRRAGTEACPYT